MKKLIASILLFIPLLLLLIGVNYFGDPANVFHANELVDSVFEITSSGKNADGVSNYADRLFVERRITAMTEPPTVAVIGSSRTAQLDSFIIGEDCFNASVAGATLEDAAAIYEIYRECGLVPKRVILCVEPWYFDVNKNDVRYGLYLSDYYESFIRRNIDKNYKYTGETLFSKNAKELFSLGYFQTSANTLINSGFSSPVRLATASDANETNTGMIRSDGSFVYPNSYLRASEQDVFARMSAAHLGILESLRDSNGIDENNRAIFEALVNDIISDGSELSLLISPYHPYVYDEVMEDPGASYTLLGIEAYLEELSAEKGIELIGSYSPYEVGFGVPAFIDALHITYDKTYELINGKM